MSDQYFSDQKYEDLSPSERARLWDIRKKINSNESNASPPTPLTNQVKRKISELKNTLRDLEKKMDPIEEDKYSVAMMITSK